jgi:Ca2+-binding EF-hand superfamily protein
MISVDELKHYLEEKNHNLTAEEINSVIKEIDYAGNGKINYSEFLCATIDVKKAISEAKLRSVFNVFDTDHSGFITA